MTNFTHSLAIVIGIDAYSNGIPRLTTAVNDATRLAGLLANAHGYETVLLTEPATSQPVTRERMQKLFTQELPARLGDDDRLLVYFASHGVALDGDDGPRGYLVPQDARPGDSASMLAMTDLHAWLTALPCRHMLAILDCCFAGAFRWASTRHIGALPDVIHQERYDRYLRSPAWQVLTSAAYDQKALDVLGGNVLGRREADGRQHSPFAQALIDALEKGAADLVPKGQGDGVITATELYLYLREQVEVQAEEQASHEQTPGALPLLSFTLSELYVKYVQGGRDDRALSGADYNALGGVVGSLRNRATEEYDALPDDAHRATMQRVMLRMVAVEGGELARRRVALSELDYPTTEENARVQTVLDRLVAARLLVRGTSDPSAGSGQALDGTRGEAYVEPAHDALVLAWDKLLRWKQEAEEYLPLQRRLAQAAGEWRKAATEAKTGLLWDDDPRLPQVEETLWPTGGKQKGLAGRARWAKQVLSPKTEMPADTKWLNGAEFRFAQASVSRRASTFRRIISITAAVVLALAGLAIFASYQANQATMQRDVAVTAEANAERSAQAEATAAADARQKQAEAEREARRAKGGELAAHAQNAVANNKADPSLALLLAIRALEVTWHAPENSVIVNADKALRDAIDVAPPWRMTVPRHRHTGWVNSAAYSPDGRFIVTASDDTTARIWDAASGAEVRALADHTGWVNSAAYSPDGRFIVTASADKTARTWDTASGAEVRTLVGHTDSVNSAAYSPDGKFIVTGTTDKRARVWDAASGAAVHTLTGHNDNVNSAVYSPDGKFIVTASDNGTARIWDAASGDAVRTLTGHTDSGSAELYKIHSAAYSPDGRFIVTAGADGTARIWDAASGDAVRTLVGHTEPVWSVTYSPDGKFIVTASWDGTARIWDAASGTEVHILAGHNDNVLSAAYSPDGRFIVTAGADGTARTWDATSGAPVRTLAGHTEPVWSVAYSPDGKFIITTSTDKTARIWDAASGATVRTLGHIDWVTSAAYSPDGRLIVTASADNTARIWDAASGDVVRALAGHTDVVNSAVYSPDGKFIVTASADNTARIWDAASGAAVNILGGYNDDVNSAAYSPDGRFIVTASADNTARIWEAASGDVVRALAGHTDVVKSAVYSPDGKFIVTASADNTARIWDAASGAAVNILGGHNDDVNSAAYSPDGRFIVTASNDETARLWDAASGATVRTLAGHTTVVTSAAYSPDGRFIVSASWDGTARIWDVASGATVRTLADHAGWVNSAAYSPDGRFIVTASNDKTARIWIAGINDLLAEAARLIQRDPPLLTPWERALYGLEVNQ